MENSIKEKARRVVLDIFIAGHNVTDIVNPCLLSFVCTDHATGKADNIELSLHDDAARDKCSLKVG